MQSINGREELVSLLQYIKETDINNPCVTSKDERLLRLDKIVNEVKQSEEWEETSMSIYGKGRQEGRQEGIQEGK